MSCSHIPYYRYLFYQCNNSFFVSFTFAAEVVDTYTPAIGDVCINPEYYCDTACGPGCMNNCVTCNSSLFNVDCYWDSQSYVGRNCSATTCANGMEWATEFSLHLYSLAAAGVLGLIEMCKDCPGTIERCSSGECATGRIAPPPAPAAWLGIDE